MTSMSQTPQTPNGEPQTLRGKYEIARRLGAGGMGEVYEARHLVLGQTCAVKILRPEYAQHPNERLRFEREAVALSKLNSPHILRVFDVDVTEDGRPFIVMELLRGLELSKEVKEREVSHEEILGWIIQVCEGLAVAHAAGIVHRDIKPSNIFLHGPERCVKIVDFGVSKLVGAQDLTATASMIGTPRYMSPEQVCGDKSIDGRSDVWSVGVMLYRYLGERFPFDKEGDPIALAMSILSDTPPLLSELRPELPSALTSLVMRCLAKDRSQRVGSTLEIADGLRAFAGARSPVAGQPENDVAGLSGVPGRAPFGSSASLDVVPVHPLRTTTQADVLEHSTAASVSDARPERKQKHIQAAAAGAAIAIVLVAMGAWSVTRSRAPALRGETVQQRATSDAVLPTPSILPPPSAVSREQTPRVESDLTKIGATSSGTPHPATASPRLAAPEKDVSHPPMASARKPPLESTSARPLHL